MNPQKKTLLLELGCCPELFRFKVQREAVRKSKARVRKPFMGDYYSLPSVSY